MTDTFIHETAVVDQPCEIGEGTKVWHFCHLMAGCRVGANCSLGQNVFVGSGAVLGDNVKVQNNVSIYDGVTVEDDVFLGPSMVFTNVSTPRSHVSRKHAYETTVVKRGASIGANATIVCGHTVGEYSFVAAGSVVTKNVVAHSLVMGNPARPRGWMCECGARLVGNLDCPECRKRYALSKGALVPRSS